MTKNKSNKLIRIVTIALIIVTAISIVSVTASAETTVQNSDTIHTYEPKPDTDVEELIFDLEEDDTYYDTPCGDYVYADLNKDGKLDTNDVKLLQDYIAEREIPEKILSEIDKFDANLDGIIDVNDVTLYQKVV